MVSGGSRSLEDEVKTMGHGVFLNPDIVHDSVLTRKLGKPYLQSRIYRPVLTAMNAFTCSTDMGISTTRCGSFSMPSNAAGTGGD